MRAFIDAEVSKTELLGSLARHRDEDRLAQGWYYWQEGRGCAVGCTLHEYASNSEYNHELYEELFGIPMTLAHLEDSIFEGLDATAAQEWPERFIRAIPEGADLERVADELALWLLGAKASPLAPWRDRDYLEPTLDLYRQHLDGLPTRRSAWREAASVVRDAAKSADSELDSDAAWATTYGHRDGEYWKLVTEAALVAANLVEQARPAGASSASVRPAVERARKAAWRLIADKLVELLESTEADPAEYE